MYLVVRVGRLGAVYLVVRVGRLVLSFQGIKICAPDGEWQLEGRQVSEMMKGLVDQVAPPVYSEAVALRNCYFFSYLNRANAPKNGHL